MAVYLKQGRDAAVRQTIEGILAEVEARGAKRLCRLPRQLRLGEAATTLGRSETR